MRSDFKTYIDIGNGWTQFYPDNVEPFKNTREPDQYFKRKGWGKVTIRNNPDLYAVASNDIYRLYDILTGTLIPSFATEELDPTDEIKIWFHNDDYDIYGYFGINDCEPDDDRNTLVVTPTIQDNYTDLLENWETKINFNNLVYSTDEIDLNIEALGTVTFADWTEIENRTVARYNKDTGRIEFVVVQDWAPNKYIRYSQWVELVDLSGFFDGQAPNYQLWTIPDTNFQDYDGFLLTNRQEILQTPFDGYPTIDQTDDIYFWMSGDTYGAADIGTSTDNIVSYPPQSELAPGETAVLYKSLQDGNYGKQPNTNPLWWSPITSGEIFPTKGDWELSEFTVWDGDKSFRFGAGLQRKVYCTTKFSRDEFRKVDVVNPDYPSSGYPYLPPTGDGWHMRSVVTVGGEAGHLWTRLPFNGGFSSEWSLQDEITNPTGLSDHFTWYAKRTSKIQYPNSETTKTIKTTILPKNFLEYVLQNTSSVFASSSVKSTFFFNDDEADLPMLADRIGENINYVTNSDNYLSTMRMIFTRDLMTDLNPSDVSTFPDVTLKKTLEDLNKLFKNTLYFYIDDSLDLHIEHIKYLDLTLNPTELRYESDGITPREELSFSEAWKYDKSMMFNRIELRQINASGVDFTENLILFDKIVSNKRNIDIKQELETEMFSTDLRYAIENSSDLENGVMLISTENKLNPVIRPQIDDLIITGTSGSAIISAGGISETLTLDVKLSVDINTLILNYAAEWLSVGITITKSGETLRFTKDGAFTNATITNISGNLTGTPVVIQTYAILSTSSSIAVKNKTGLISGVNESNGYMALSNLLYDFGRYEGTWENALEFDGITNVPIEKTTRTKKGKEIRLRGIYDSLFYKTNLGVGLLDNGVIDFTKENSTLNLSYRYNSEPDADGFILMVQKATDFEGAEDIWFDFANYET